MTHGMFPLNIYFKLYSNAEGSIQRIHKINVKALYMAKSFGLTVNFNEGKQQIILEVLKTFIVDILIIKSVFYSHLYWNIIEYYDL